MFDPIQKKKKKKKKRDYLKFYRLPDATFYDRTNIIYQFIKPCLDKKGLFFLRNMEPLKFEKKTLAVHFSCLILRKYLII